MTDARLWHPWLRINRVLRRAPRTVTKLALQHPLDAPDIARTAGVKGDDDVVRCVVRYDRVPERRRDAAATVDSTAT